MAFPDDFLHDPNTGSPIPEDSLPDEEFLRRLAWYMRWVGWSVDHGEVAEFFRELVGQTEFKPEDFNIDPPFEHAEPSRKVPKE